MLPDPTQRSMIVASTSHFSPGTADRGNAAKRQNWVLHVRDTPLELGRSQIVDRSWGGASRLASSC